MAAEFCMTRNEEEEAADQCDEHPYDAVSLCDLPLSPPPPPEEDKVSGNGGGDHITHSAAAECSQLMSSESDDQFEFGWSRDVVLMKKKKKKKNASLEANWPEMCSPEDVFANGQLLPYRPSVSSETSGLLEVDVLEKSCRSLSRSESLGLNSCYFTSSSRNSSSSRSSFCDSSDRRGRRSSVDSPAGNLLYSNPPRSPIPRKRADQVLFHDHYSPEFPTGKMGLFRLNLVRTPEIRLRDLRHRQKKKEDLAKHESTVVGSRKVSSSSQAVVGWSPWRRMFSGMDCKCSVVSDTVSVTITRRKGDQLEEVKSGRVLKLDNKINESTSRRRTFEWVNELSFAHRDYESSNFV